MRRASIALLYHLTKMAQAGERIPNLYDMKSTFWKHLLELNPGRLPTELHSSGILETYQTIGHLLGPPVEVERAKSVGGAANDQILAYAAETFSTIVCNNAWVPLIPRLTRLTNCIVRSKGACNKVKTYLVIKAIISGDPKSIYDMPAWTAEYVNDVRRRLLLKSGQRLYDKYGKTINFHDMFMFNFWMQQRFTELEAKRISLSPVCKVGRVHCRLDRKVLLLFLKQHCPDRHSVARMLELEKLYAGLPTNNPDDMLPSRPTFPSKKADPNEEPRVQLVLKHTKVDEPKVAFKIMKRLDKNGELKTKLTVLKEPKLPDRPLQAFLHLADPSKERDPKEVAAEKVARNQAIDEWKKAVNVVRTSSQYLAQKARYDSRIEAETVAIQSLFKDRVASKTGWRFDGSVVTNGVAVSMQYSKRVKQPPLVTSKPKRTGKDSEPAIDYDRNLPTVIRDKSGRVAAIVLGVDPGRSNIATVSYVLDDETVNQAQKDGVKVPKSKTWQLNRSQYYEISEIRKLDKAYKKWYEKMDFSILKDGSLRTADADQDIVKYLELYSTIRDRWWSLALRRRESRLELQRYSGKRKALDSFFSKVNKEVKSLFPDFVVKVGYGSAYQSMKPTGKGETAVPTTGAYKACKRIFGAENTRVVDEFRSTVASWESGVRKETVFRIVDSEVVEGVKTVYRCRVGHTKEVVPPVPERDKGLVSRYVAACTAKRARRRKGSFLDSGEETTASSEGEEVSSCSYPMVKGLLRQRRTATGGRQLFCPEKSIYLRLAFGRRGPLWGQPEPGREGSASYRKVVHDGVVGKAKTSTVSQILQATVKTCVQNL